MKIKAKASSMLVKNITVLYVIIFAMALLTAGSTFAWFNVSISVLGNYFTVGYVEVESDPDKQNPPSVINVSDDLEIHSWYLKNTGNKTAYVRVRIEAAISEFETDTAWAGGDVDDKTFIELNLAKKWGWIIYYPVGQSTNTEPFSRNLYAGAGGNDISKGEMVGILQIYDDPNDNNYILIKYVMIGDFKLQEVHLDVRKVDSIGDRPSTPNNVPPGQLNFQSGQDGQEQLNSPASEYTFKINKSVNGFESDDILAIAAHGVVSNPANSSLILINEPWDLGEDCIGSWKWFKNEEDSNYVDLPGYYYYWDSSIGDGGFFKPVGANETLEICFDMWPLYSGEMEVSVVIEAIQKSNEAYKSLWPETYPLWP